MAPHYLAKLRIHQFGKESTMVVLRHMEEGATSNNMKKAIMKAVQDVTSISIGDIAKRTVAYGACKQLLI
jgi:hypothetical protein